MELTPLKVLRFLLAERLVNRVPIDVLLTADDLDYIDELFETREIDTYVREAPRKAMPMTPSLRRLKARRIATRRRDR